LHGFADATWSSQVRHLKKVLSEEVPCSLCVARRALISTLPFKPFLNFWRWLPSWLYLFH
jgi:hypothetical protein